MGRIILLAALAAAALAAEAPRIVASTYPIWLLTRAVAHGRAQPDLLLGPALGCPHDYVLTPQDLAKLARADLLVVNGLGLEEFLGAPVATANPRLAVVDSSRAVPAGDLICDEEQGDGHGGAGAEAGACRHGRNPHLFASPRQAARIVRYLGEELARADAGGAETYRANAAAAARRLDQLAEELRQGLAVLANRKLVAQHGVFAYLARDSGLEVVGEIQAHPGNDPSAAALSALVAVIRSSGARAVFTEPQYPEKVGEVVAREAGIPVARLDPVASGPGDPPADHYEAAMRANLATLLRVLGRKP